MGKDCSSALGRILRAADMGLSPGELGGRTPGGGSRVKDGVVGKSVAMGIWWLLLPRGLF